MGMMTPFTRRQDRVNLPDGMPTLSAGAHADPTAGACLMEYVSVLAGERPSDRPKCVHPGLAAVARVVNDAVADTVRQGLILLAPDCINTQQAGTAVDPVLVGIVAAIAADLHPDSRQARVELAAAKRRLRRLRRGGRVSRAVVAVSNRRYRLRAEWVLPHLVARDIVPSGDVQAVAALQAVLDECRRHVHTEPAITTRAEADH